MIAPCVVAEVRRLLEEEQLSQRKIALRTGISRGTIHAIASGKRPDYPVHEPTPEEDEPIGPPERCPTCGGMVYMPCRLCKTREKIDEQRKVAGRHIPPDDSLRLELRPEHRARYEEVCLWRELYGAPPVSAPVKSLSDSNLIPLIPVP